MKLICIKEDDKRFGYKLISINQQYDGEIHDPNEDKNYWVVKAIDLRGHLVNHVFSKENFMTLDECRDSKINNILSTQN